jgi:hypothetical protein
MSMTDPDTKSKLLRLIEYLSALARINSRIVRSCDEYEAVLWLDEIPREPKFCFSRSFGISDERTDDAWIEIKKFSEPALPLIPAVCKDWIDYDSIRKTEDFPKLFESITKTETVTDPSTQETIQNM